MMKGLTFLLIEKLQKKSRHVLVAGAKTSLFAKIPAALFLLKKLAENFLTLIARFLPTHFAMCGGECRNTKCVRNKLFGLRYFTGACKMWEVLEKALICLKYNS